MNENLVRSCINKRYMGRRVRARGAVANLCNQALDSLL